MKAPPAPVRSPSAGMSSADMEANLSQYRLFQEKKKRIGLTFSPFPLLIVLYRTFGKGKGPLPLIHTFPYHFLLWIGHFVQKGTQMRVP